MPGGRTKQSIARRLSSNKSDRQPSDGVDPDGASAQEVVTLTPFSIDVYTNANYANGNAGQPMQGYYAIHIRPESIWASLAKYRNLDIRGETYSVHQYAIIARSVQLPKLCNPLKKPDKVECVARILEIRARDAQNVYARVYWVYRPEHTPGGRQSYHGENELLASNHMEIVDALTFVRRVDVVHWVQEDGVQAPAPAEGMYWRQTYDFISGKVSPLSTHCVCHKPVNLHKLTIQCTNPRCMILLHPDCLIEYELLALLERYENQKPQDSSATSLHPLSPQDGKSKIKMEEGDGEHFRVEIGDSVRKEHMGRTRFMYTDLWEPREWEKDIKCLKCGEKIERTGK